MPSETGETALVEALQAGDEEAVKVLMDEYWVRVLGYTEAHDHFRPPRPAPMIPSLLYTPS